MRPGSQLTGQAGVGVKDTKAPAPQKVKIKWTPAAVMVLDVRTDLPTAFSILVGLGRAEAYRAVERATLHRPGDQGWSASRSDGSADPGPAGHRAVSW
jgi:hypothetical protein